MIRAERIGKAATLFGRLLENRFTRPVKRSVVRWMVAYSTPRYLLNRYYRLLSFETKSRFHARYAKAFRGGHHVTPGEWTIDFLGRRLRLPLRPSSAWLDWDYAVSVLGHDADIKRTYEALIKSDRPPTLFLDVGANYGTHAILFLALGIPTIAFEPNPECLPQFQTVCQLNELSGRMESVAIGNRHGEITLVYPEKEAWLGSTSKSIIARLRHQHNSMAERIVPIRKLDDYERELSPGEELLIKIDVEGSELEVLEGSRRLLCTCRAKIIFESNDNKNRPRFAEFLWQCGYDIYSLPWRPNGTLSCLGISEFEASRATNFIAISRREMLDLAQPRSLGSMETVLSPSTAASPM